MRRAADGFWYSQEHKDGGQLGIDDSCMRDAEIMGMVEIDGNTAQLVNRAGAGAVLDAFRAANRREELDAH
jgi:hypothetical protein